MTYITARAPNMKFKYVHFKVNIQRLNSGKSKTTNHTRTQREVLASTMLEVEHIYVREIGSGWKADEKYSPLQLSLLLCLQYFSAQIVKPNISMSVCITAPLFPHSCSGMSFGMNYS